MNLVELKKMKQSEVVDYFIKYVNKKYFEGGYEKLRISELKILLDSPTDNNILDIMGIETSNEGYITQVEDIRGILEVIKKAKKND